MAQAMAYAVVRVHDDSYRLDRLTPPGTGAAAFVIRFRDRLGNPLGWRLKPMVVMQGAKSRIWPNPAEAFASTKLMTVKQAREAITRADNAASRLATDVQP